MPTVAIIIPYFQRKQGILRRTLLSVREQKLPPNVTADIIVVDDGSPISAESEVKDISFPASFRLRIVPQPNSGVAAARNKGLRSIDAATTYVAFLDSDDVWDPMHLSVALGALEQGYDFYFCDCRRVGNPESAFAEKNFSDFLSGPSAQLIGDQLYRVDRDAFFNKSVPGRPCGIQSIVFRRSAAPDLFFDETMKISGEDCLFLLRLTQKAERICCSPHEYVSLLDGVNIFASKKTWESPGHLARYMSVIVANYRYRANLSLTQNQDNFFKAQIKHNRKLFAYLSVRQALKRRKPWSAELKDTIRLDPSFWLWYPFYLLYVCVGIPLRFYDPLQQFNNIYLPDIL